MFSTLLGLALIQAAPTLDVRVEGEGYLRFEREGRMVFARAASLAVVKGQLIHAKGLPLMPLIEGFRQGESPTVLPNGEVKAIGPSGAARPLGRLTLALFPGDIRPLESQGFLVAADRPLIAYPGTGRAGTLLTGGSAATSSATPAGSPQPAPGPRPTPSSPAKLHIALKDQAEAAGDKILLSDLADLTGPTELIEKAKGLDFGPCPPIGIARPIERASIETRLARGGILLSNASLEGPAKVTVQRKGQKITHEMFVEAARQAVSKETGSSFALEPLEPGPVMISPLGELVLKGESVTLVKDLATATIAVYVDGRRFNSRTLRLRAATPLSNFKIGQTVTIRVKAGGATVECRGKIRSLDIPKGEATVDTPTGALLTGRPAKDGAIEVTL